MKATIAHSTTASQMPPPLSPELRVALRAATLTLHKLAWSIGQVALDQDDCETIAANVIVAYFAALEDDDAASHRCTCRGAK